MGNGEGGGDGNGASEGGGMGDGGVGRDGNRSGDGDGDCISVFMVICFIRLKFQTQVFAAPCDCLAWYGRRARTTLCSAFNFFGDVFRRDVGVARGVVAEPGFTTVASRTDERMTE